MRSKVPLPRCCPSCRLKGMGHASAIETRARIESRGASVYDAAVDATSDMFHTPSNLELLIDQRLRASPTVLEGLPVRSRSKVAKSLVCEALGYRPPLVFSKTQPRLPHANVDVYVQQSNNLQVWNEEVDSARRYVIILLDGNGQYRAVKVIAGADLAQFDTTGTLTSKFQANRINEMEGSQLVSPLDTPDLVRRLNPTADPLNLSGESPTALPRSGSVLTVDAVYRRLLALVGTRFVDPGITQERNRGTVVHREACRLLGLDTFSDNGQFPDVLSQALEVKLQLARTVDLGLELPDSSNPVASLNGLLAVRDIRYAVFYGERDGAVFDVTSLVVVTGAEFFSAFRQFGGNVSNKKLQLRLPDDWFKE